MLSRLSINNYALIKSLDMQPHESMNTITGETGAGKSIMLGAVGLLLGNRADTKVLYEDDKKCIIEGEFSIKDYKLNAVFEKYDLDYETDTLIRREITPNGKSRAFVNDTPVTLDILKELGSRLMDVHSQHQTLLLGSANYQLNLIDIYADSSKLLSEYQAGYQAYKKSEEHLSELLNNAERISQESDYNDFLLKELTEANLSEDEQELLEEELKLLEHAEEIKGNLNNILSILDKNEQPATAMLQESQNLIRQISSYTESLNGISKRLDEAYIELSDLVREIEMQEQNIAVDFARTEEVRDRISMIYHLQNKHHVSNIKGLLDVQEKLEKETFIANHLDEQIEGAKKQMEADEGQMLQKADKVSARRKGIFRSFEKEIIGLLQQLGMPDGKLQIEWQPKKAYINGIDEISINFSANKGVNPAPLNKVASGGEFSRLMFCFKYVIADKTALPTMVFDEIDSGISGEIALQMGKMMQKMAQNHQVITISHLPQIAAKGDSHYFVYKEVDSDRSMSMIKKLTEEDRVKEIAKMIGGDSPSEHAFESAKELVLS
ncbi:MAG: DNA repair protein RecN [Bacteroidetes bacterium]|nr:MAG: DNA repair protein RecN [Bacteroidota bacterium]